MRKKRWRLIVTCGVLLVIVLSLFKFNIIEKVLYPYPYREIVEKYAHAYGVDPYLVVAVMREESHFKPESYSHKGAVGLMQVMPNTAKEIALWLGEDYKQEVLTDPETNIRYGTRYLSHLNNRFAGNSILVLASYNAGSGRVQQWLKQLPEGTTYLIEDIPYQETKQYVKKVLRSYRIYAKIYNDRTYSLKDETNDSIK
ncbi:MAG: lytic transglycosylase domain-containing protein [Peptococcaceae bacterium]|nr:lytic transglycosylase domain-containing protein [Peptococcaceae bacterium]